MKPLIINNKETDYAIDESGQIYSYKTNKFLTGTIMNTGYCMVRLTTRDGNKKGYSLHRLVAENFLPNPNNYPIVNHKDGDKTNNCVENLEWVSASENRKHAVNNQISDLAFGERKKINFSELNLDEWQQYKNTNYYISKKGEVYNNKTNILLKQTPNASGYIRYTLRIDGKNISKLGHCLVLETWCNYVSDKDKVINHINGNKSDNRLENLEVVSKKENALHSCYTLHNLVKPILRHGDEIIEFPSISEAARQHHVTEGAIRYALKNKSKCCGFYWSYK